MGLENLQDLVYRVGTSIAERNGKVGWHCIALFNNAIIETIRGPGDVTRAMRVLPDPMGIPRSNKSVDLLPNDWEKDK